MIRTIAANCRTSARQITGPTAEQLNAAADAIGELIEEAMLLDRVRERHGDESIGLLRMPTGSRKWAVMRWMSRGDGSTGWVHIGEGATSRGGSGGRSGRRR
jgi:hypothetical protein